MQDTTNALPSVDDNPNLVAIRSKLPQLQAKTREELVKKEPKVVQQYRYDCWCCHDTGSIEEHLARLIMPDYVRGVSAPLYCNASGCEFWQRPEGKTSVRPHPQDGYDFSVPVGVCDELSKYEKEYLRLQAMKRHKERQQGTHDPNAVRKLISENLSNVAKPMPELSKAEKEEIERSKGIVKLPDNFELEVD